MKVSRLTVILAIGLGLAGSSLRAADVVEDWEKDLQREDKIRISRWILSLNAPPSERREATTRLVEESRGENGAVVLELLHDTFSLNNPQIREGVVEVLAEIARPESVPILARQLRFDSFMDVRIRIMRLLPVFLLPEEPKLREEILALAARENYSMTERLRSALQRGPLRLAPHGYDADLDHLRRSVVQALMSQLDPVATAIEGLGSKKDDSLAQETVLYFLGRSLGESQDESLERWKTLGLESECLKIMDISILETTAAQMLADVGAEGSEELIRLLQRLTRVKRPAANETALQAAAALTRVARRRLLEHRAWLQEHASDRQVSEVELKWREQGVQMAERTIRFTYETGTTAIASPTEEVRVAGYRCLGASGNPEAVETLRRQFVTGNEPLGMQARIAEALGEIGGEQAVQVLAVLADHKTYAAAGEPQAQEYRLMLAMIEALARIAGRYDQQQRVLVVGDTDVGTQAFRCLLDLLQNERPLPGGPRRADDTPVRMQDLVLRQIQLIVGVEDPTLDPERWFERYLSLVKQREKIG